jgi:FimV-like protein
MPAMIRAPRPTSRLFQRTALWAALSLTLLGHAQALTLSRPLVESKQGEVLKAEIDILDMSAKEQVDFQAALAAPEVYKATKLEAPASNGKALDIQVKLLKRSNGNTYLAITSQQPVSGNFLDVLLDLRWSTGRLLRAVSLSLDDARQPAPQNPTSALGASAQAISVQRGDTASGLALNHKPTTVSLDQMLLAMLRSNPDAFVDANVNRMKAGALLTMPTEQEVKAISREEARQAIQVQTNNFLAYRAELANRAPGGVVPKAARDSAGKLEARVDNKKAASKQDKLTLSKPTSNGAEEKIAQQREAQEVASRAAEIGRNIAELGKIAAATATPSASGDVPADLPASPASSRQDWLTQLTSHTLAPVGAGCLIGLLVLIGLWRRRANQLAQGDNIQGLPPLNVKFDLDLPNHDTVEPAFYQARTNPVETTEEAGHAAESTLASASDAAVNTQPARPTLDIPKVSLDFNEPVIDGPFQVRIDLADELWKLGQLHTSRALMEEVASESTGEVQDRAKRWLAERG